MDVQEEKDIALKNHVQEDITLSDHVQEDITLKNIVHEDIELATPENELQRTDSIQSNELVHGFRLVLVMMYDSLLNFCPISKKKLFFLAHLG